MRTAIATAIVVAIGLDVVRTAIGADKVGKETHLVLRGVRGGFRPRWLNGGVFRISTGTLDEFVRDGGRLDSGKRYPSSWISDPLDLCAILIGIKRNDGSDASDNVVARGSYYFLSDGCVCHLVLRGWLVWV